MKVSHHKGCYEVEFTSLARAFEALPSNARVLTDSNLFRLYGKALPEDLTIVVPAGEASKRLRVFEHCLEKLAAMGTRREDCLVGFGGGVIGDLAGFVASAYMRGITFVQVPTTLLAQVDSSIGGKVGVDLEAGKNLAGAFYPPQAVYVPLEVLRTLDERQFINGMAEVWKYGFIWDAQLVERLKTGACSQRNLSELKPVVRRCLQIKSEIVEEDEFERNGIRAKLNFGHTIGHAIERINGYQRILHGEAIAIGMVVEATLGESLGITEAGAATVVASSLEKQGLPTKWDRSWNSNELLDAMMLDKKRSAEGLAFSLLTRIGECKLVHGVSTDSVNRILDSL